MRKITLVCSGHKVNGQCNAEALLMILRSIEPEVVFVEFRPSDWESYFKTKLSLEAQAISEYRVCKSIPVDQYDFQESLAAAEGYGRAVDFVEQVSQEYWDLNKENYIGAQQRGFSCLNSAAFAARRERMSQIEDEKISETDDQSLIDGLQLWRRNIRRREVEMVRNIYRYCRTNVFETGVFLVGAAHKTSLVQQIEKYAGREADLINWSFAYEGLIP